MNRLIRFLLGISLLALAGCDYDYITTETGYKGRARVNPWLAAERFSERLGYEVESLGSWRAPSLDDSVCFVPASILSNEGFTGSVERWVGDGGHLVVLVEHAEADWDDWNRFAFRESRLEPALFKMLGDAGITLKSDDEKTASKIRFGDQDYTVDATSEGSVKKLTGKPGVFTSVKQGAGRISVLMDARLLRSRAIGNEQHASLLRALIEAGANEGRVMFVRGSGISLWGMLWRHLWPALLGLALLTALWLWKNFSRFGPMDAEVPVSPLRGYDHHLEALGDFQWRLDKGSALLAPLRERIIENGQRMASRSGRRDDDFFQLLADLALLPRERVQRALTESGPGDSATLTRTAADIQKILEVLRS